MRVQRAKFEVEDRDILETQMGLQFKGSDEYLNSNIENARLGRRKKTEEAEAAMYSIMRKHKVQNLVKMFINKLRINSVYRQPCQIQDIQPLTKKSNKGLKLSCSGFSQKQGLAIGNIGLAIWCLVNIIQITVMVFVYSIIITFAETQKFKTFFNFRIISIVLYIIDMFLNFTVKRYQNGKSLRKLGEIAKYYLKHQFAIDIASIMIFPFDAIFTFSTNLELFIFFFSLIKLINNVQKLQKLEYIFINSTGKQQYAGLIKVLLTNFVIAHFLSIALNWMGEIDTTKNWRQRIGVQDDPWYIQYIWGYYWATNIMFTVGFGDLCASNWKEAAILVFIEAFSCITLAYNISYIGGLIGSLRENQAMKTKKLKIFHRMCEENNVKNQVQERVTNFIEEEYRIKKQFEYETHDQILNGLPQVFQAQYRQSANRSLFQNLGKLTNLFKKDLLSLAQTVQRKVCYPQEVVLKRASIPEFIILQKGILSLNCRIRSTLDGKQISVIEVKEGQSPIILSLDFLKNKSPIYDIKSKTYSVVYRMTKEELIKSLKANNDGSFQTLCFFQDKVARSIYQTYQTLPCALCKNENHTKFQCNRLHYVPLSQHVIFKHIHNENQSKQPRHKFRRQKKQLSAAMSNKKCKSAQRKFVEENFDDHHFKQMENLFRFYTQIPEGQAINVNQFKTPNNRDVYEGQSPTKLQRNRTFKQIEKLLQSKSSQNVDFWEIQCDLAENFRNYFNQSNPENLSHGKRKLKSFYSLSNI